MVRLYDTDYVMADIAGIIEGAHQGLGLGFKFLKHIERTKVLIHVVDVSGCEGRDPIEDFDKIMKELESYSDKITKKPMLVAANKIDLIEEDDENYLKFKAYVEDKGYKVFPISAPLNLGVKELLSAAAEALAKAELNPPPEEEYEYFDFESEKLNDADYRRVDVRCENGQYIIEGQQLQKIFDSTNFNDMGSLRYLYKYIEKSGALKKLRKMGLEEGDIVKIGDFELEYYDEYDE